MDYSMVFIIQYIIVHDLVNVSVVFRKAALMPSSSVHNTHYMIHFSKLIGIGISKQISIRVETTQDYLSSPCNLSLKTVDQLQRP